MNYFVTAIGTDSGKTLTSAVLITALKANYWKPVQAGKPTDTDILRKWFKGQPVKFFNEAFLLKKAASPHEAAREEGLSLSLKDIIIPDSTKPIIIEGAGGLMVPLNDEEFMVDLAKYLEAEIILVADLYLGSINHTLLSVELLKQKGLKVKGIIFNGPENKASQDLILKQSGYPLLLHMTKEKQINAHVLNNFALGLLKNWNHASQQSLSNGKG